MREGWEIKKLGEVCKYAKKQGTYSDLPYVGMEDIESNTHVFTGSLTPKKVASSTFRFCPNSLLFGRLRPYLRKSMIPDFEGHCSTEIFPIVTTANLNVYFLQYWFGLDAICDLVNESCTGARMPRANMNKVLDFNISYPSLPEQQRIVTILDITFAKIDAMRSNAEKNLQGAKDLFQVALKQELSHKEGWANRKLNELCEVKDGTHDSPKYIDDGVPFVTQKNITTNGLDISNTKFITVDNHEKFYKRSNVAIGDILISMIGANRGMSCIVDIKDIFSIKNVGLIKQGDKIDQKYLLFFLKSQKALSYVASASNGGAQEFIGLTSLRAFPIDYPIDVNEQQAIVTKLDYISDRCKQLEQNYQQTIEHCQALKQAILIKAFNGEL